MREHASTCAIAAAVREALRQARPEVVFHLAAQPHGQALAARSGDDVRGQRDGHGQRPGRRAPGGRGGARGRGRHLRQVLRESRRVVHALSGELSHEQSGEPSRRFVEDPLGGADPYSSSKACAELVAGAYRRSFFSAADSPRLGTARAGNVIGGGDWGEDRLVPDTVRAVESGEPLQGPQPARGASLAARAQPAQRVSAPRAEAVAGRRRAGGARVELRAARRTMRGRSAGSSSGWPSCGTAS